MSESVEWALHCCLLLAWVGGDQPVPASELAAGYELPSAYLNKRLQALVRAGILASSRGSGGGFWLARPPEAITLMDIVAAIEGPEEAFRCKEIRRRGAGKQAPEQDFRLPCAISTAMQKAEIAWRRALAAQTVADVRAAADRNAPRAGERVRRRYSRD